MGTADSALDEQAVSESYGPSAADRGEGAPAGPNEKT